MELEMTIDEGRKQQISIILLYFFYFHLFSICMDKNRHLLKLFKSTIHFKYHLMALTTASIKNTISIFQNSQQSLSEKLQNQISFILKFGIVSYLLYSKSLSTFWIILHTNKFEHIFDKTALKMQLFNSFKAAAASPSSI